MSISIVEILIILIVIAIPLALFVALIVALGRKRGAGRAMAGALTAVAIVLFLLVGLIGLAFIGTRTVVHQSTISDPAVHQANEQIVHAQATIDQTRRQIEAQAAEIRARINNGNTPGDGVMYEDPATHTSEMVEPVTVSDRVEAPNNSPGLQVLPDDPNVQIVPPRAPTDTVNDGVTALNVVSEQPPKVRGTPEVVQSSTGVTVAGRPWTDAVEEFRDFEADVYPSIETAAEALGRNIGRDLMEHVPAAQPANTTPVYVWMQSDGEDPATRDGVLLVTRPVLEAVADGIRQKLVNPDVVTVERPTAGRSSAVTAEDGVIVVRVHVNDVRFDNHNRWRKHTESGSGFLVAEVDTPDFDFSRNMRFDQKPWVADPSRFASQYPGGHWLIAYSDMSNTQQVFAHNDAIRAAAESLLPKAEAYVSRLSPGQQHLYEQKKAADPDWLRKRIADELVSRNHQTDSFVQRYDRPNYTVWREALLIDAGPGVVENITAAMVNSLSARQADQRNTWFSFIALAGLIFGTYLFLNMATKGYYAWMLRLAAVAGVGGAVLLIRFLA